VRGTINVQQKSNFRRSLKLLDAKGKKDSEREGGSKKGSHFKSSTWKGRQKMSKVWGFGGGTQDGKEASGEGNYLEVEH